MKSNHIHLDVSGGIAGDMFSASILDAYPEYWPELTTFLSSLNINCNPTITLSDFTDGVLCGKKFTVSIENQQHEHSHGGSPNHSHSHTHWTDIRNWILELSIEDDVKHQVLGIFSVLADAEAKVHGKQPELVCFHEVGAWDSIADIMSAGWLLAKLGDCSWSVSKLPWGGGRAKTDHGFIPVPAPATIELLKGFEFFDDGVAGERITPTGAAILAWISPSIQQTSGKLEGVGQGFGNKKLTGMSNVLRSCVLKKTEALVEHSVVIMECDIDDQSPESLACSIEILRQLDDVIDITQTISIGKKGRCNIHLRFIVRAGSQNEVATQIFSQTTTIGVRYYLASRFELNRGNAESSNIRLKWVDRPISGITAKAEMDDIGKITHSHDEREALRREVENDIVKVIKNDGK